MDKKTASDTKGTKERYAVSIKNDLTAEELAKLQAIVDSKHTLLCSAFKLTALPVNVEETKITFPWFILSGVDGEELAYTQFVQSMAEMAKKQKRVVAKDKVEENEKLAMRLFIVRLGLKGEQYRLIRKLLTQDLPGDGSWKHGKPERADKPQKAATITEVPKQHKKVAEKAEKTPNTPENNG